VTDGMPGKNESMLPRKQRGIRSLAGGTGLGLVLGCAIGAFCFYRPRPKPPKLETPKPPKLETPKPPKLNVIPAVEPTTVTVNLSEESPMRVDTPDKTETIPVRKRRGIRWIAGGTGLGLVLGCAIGAFYFYRSRPKPWNLDAIRAVEPKTAAVDLSVGLLPDPTSAGAGQAPDSASVKPAAFGRAVQDPTSSVSEQSQNAEPGLTGIAMAGLQNTTSEDITLPQTVLVMESEEGTHVLHSSKFKLDHDYFIPAGRAVSVTLLADDPCAPGNSPEMCVESYFQGVDEIVLFDKPVRYEVHIPIKAIRLLRIEPKKQPETRVAVPTGTAVVRRQPNGTAVVRQQPNSTALVRQQPNTTAVAPQQPNGTVVVRQQPNSVVGVPQQPNSTAVVPQQPQQ
jgi:hypothetical protein